MIYKNVKYILTDIEGTTTSVKFVYETLFPYFRENMDKLNEMKHRSDVQEAFKAVVHLANKLENKRLRSTDEIIETLNRWSREDKKITPLKSVQGIIWEDAYSSGEIKGHVYEDVPEAFKNWKNIGIRLGVFSSGSVAAQKLIFTYSELGDLSVYFSNYFDTNIGGKREGYTYTKIANELELETENILFLSDICEELEAAESAGMQTCQLVRYGTQANWTTTAENFIEIQIEE